MYFKTRDEEAAFLKNLWLGIPTACPECGFHNLEHLHKKAKKSNTEWKCPGCGKIFRTINMLKDLPEK
ncbi:MAG: hypothetical protein E7489_07365 [Ruminococcaceae bacterium]|nr:hypothetical protein [Oscillospiraceae bacterium]